jgi:hypothetical protein
VKFNLNISTREIERKTSVPKTTTHLILTDTSGIKEMKNKKDPYILSDTLKEKKFK